MSGTPLGRGPYRNGVRRREQIVAQASGLFAQLGYAGGSIRTIAERVGVAPASLLQHFGSKEGLLEAVLEDWARQTDAQIYGADLHGLAVWDSFRDLMRFHVQNRGLLELFLTMAAEATNLEHPAHNFIKQRYASDIARQAGSLREARDLGQVGPLSDSRIDAEAAMFYAVLDGLELQWLLDDQVDLVGLVGQYLDDALVRWRAGLPPQDPGAPAASTGRNG